MSQRESPTRDRIVALAQSGLQPGEISVLVGWTTKSVTEILSLCRRNGLNIPRCKPGRKVQVSP